MHAVGMCLRLLMLSLTLGFRNEYCKLEVGDGLLKFKSVRGREGTRHLIVLFGHRFSQTFFILRKWHCSSCTKKNTWL